MEKMQFVRGLALVIASVLSAPGLSCQSAPTSQTPQVVGGIIPSYGHEIDDLKKYLGDVFATLKSGDPNKLSSYYTEMVIPDHGRWFQEAFGPAEGARLDSLYESLQSPTNDWIRERFELAAKKDKTEPEVTVYQRLSPIGPDHILRGVTRAMVEPFPIFSVEMRSGLTDDSAVRLGEFVVVDSRFRYLDAQVWSALSTIPAAPMRVRVGGNVLTARLVNRVEPVYPELARQNRIEGAVKLRVVVGTDGTVQQIEVLDGAPELRKAALDAVKQWRFVPTLLNGNPVEVDAAIEVNFNLR